jgi:hypothetical protein
MVLLSREQMDRANGTFMANFIAKMVLLLSERMDRANGGERINLYALNIDVLFGIFFEFCDIET